MDSSRSLDEIEAAHAAVGGIGRGRRYATEQINHAYAVLLSSQFQKFCRDLHSDAVDLLANAMATPVLRDMFRKQLTDNRKLDIGNPNPGNIGSDFMRITLAIWPSLLANDLRNQKRRESLESLNRWRNAIAHQDFDVARLGMPAKLHLAHIRRWRVSCDALAAELDFATAKHLTTILGRSPW